MRGNFNPLFSPLADQECDLKKAFLKTALKPPMNAYCWYNLPTPRPFILQTLPP